MPDMHDVSAPIPPPADRMAIDSPDAAIERVRSAATDTTPLVDYGDFHAGLGHRPPVMHRRYRYTHDVIEHHQHDLVVKAAAGATLGQLQRELARHGQFLPLDGDQELTIGELILHNVWGPLRIGFGAARDLLLGARFIDGRGGDIRTGGRTVKNVAGYDLSRFMVGSLGEMGMLIEATLRTAATPAHVRLLELALDTPARLDEAIPHLLTTDAAPAAMDLAASDGRWVLRLGYFGQEQDTRYQAGALEQWLTEAGLATADTGLQRDGGDLPAWQQRAAEHRAWQKGAAALLKLILPPAVTGKVLEDLHRHLPGAGLHWLAYPAHGVIWVGGDADAAALGPLDARAAEHTIAHAGMKAWYRRPDDARHLAAFAPPQPDWPLLARIRHALDPQRLFNPGRMLPPLMEGRDE